MERFDFFFGLHLGERLHSHINNLSKDLQSTDWRLVLVHQATPKLPKITLEGSIMRLLILSSVLSISNGDQYEAEFKFLEVSYREDVDTGALPWHATEYFQGHPTRI